MKYLVLVGLAFFSQLWAQSDNDIPKYRLVFPEYSQPQRDTVATKVVTSKPQNVDFKISIDKEVQYIIDTIQNNNKNIKKAKGYRLAVYNGPDKEELRKVKEYVYSFYPDINIISEYKQPDYKIKIGDFLSRFEAFEVLGKISGQYPNALIVPEVVDINPPKTDE